VDGAIICEPEELELCLFQKGAMRVEISPQARWRTGAMPYAGINPIPPLMDFLAGRARLEHAEQTRLGDTRAPRPSLADPDHPARPAQGEAQLNVMPDSAYAALDVRTVPGQDHKKVWASLEALAEKNSGCSRTLLTLLEDRPWTQTAPDDPLVRGFGTRLP
jgi:succinyl-diaminopimelate desuccinylase